DGPLEKEGPRLEAPLNLPGEKCVPGQGRQLRAAGLIVLLDSNLALDRGHALRRTRNCDRLVRFLLVSGSSAQYHGTLAVGIDLDAGQAADLVLGQLGFYLGGNDRVF